MKKKAIALAVALAMAAAVGCGATETAKGGEKERMVVKHDDGWSYMVYVDTETGVEYLWLYGVKKGSVTVMVNPDGTPKIAKGY